MSKTCEKCIHYGVCIIHDPCGYYEEERPHGECRDRLKEVFREQSRIIGSMFHLSEIEKIIDGEDWV